MNKDREVVVVVPTEKTYLLIAKRLASQGKDVVFQSAPVDVAVDTKFEEALQVLDDIDASLHSVKLFKRSQYQELPGETSLFSKPSKGSYQNGF